ncbi:hypothetical protein [Lysobacter silvisoli]|uniref:DUF2007 domain-containing protein n=1 Tax=Lysobacter silvisoli TaxID=2293254 RepID=A0A371JX05_9GAMM|nr:hypothetical protein [Lysobacter silvisoli]RDZ26175.1 hypothetical protein DX914_18045 [Lysobacter silvisoli]
MRFIARFHHADTLAQMQSRLRRKGVPTHAMQIEGQRLGEQWVLFVYLDEQVEDALRLLRDPEHVPALSVDVSAFESMRPVDDGRLFAKWVTIVGAVVVLGFVALALLLRLLR